MKSILLLALAALTLSSCAPLTNFLVSPLGQASLVTAEALGKQLAKAAEKRVLEQIIIKADAQIRTLKAHGPNADLAKEIIRTAELAGLQAVYDAAQVQYTARYGSPFTLPKNPVPNLTP